VKLLFISHFYPPTHIGGTETYTHGLAQGLVRAGHQVQILCAGDWESGQDYLSGSREDVYQGVPVRRLQLNWTKAPDPNHYLYDNPVTAHYLQEWLPKFEPDLVHVTSCNTLSASVIGVAKRMGIPVVVTLTDFWFICPQVTLLRSDRQVCDGQVAESECLECLLRGAKVERWSKRMLPQTEAVRFLGALSRYGKLTRLPGLRGMALDIHERRAVLHQALEQADRVLIASASARELFRRNGFTMPIEVVPYGHDLTWLSGYSGKSPSKEVRFGFIGQIAPMKGPQVLVESFRSANRDGRARLLIYGNLDKDPSFGEHLRALAAGCAEIEFRGTYPHRESGRIFAELDVLVVPSLWHDYPLIINEAFATGTPVIASDFGGMSEFVKPGVNGLLFERGSVENLACQLRRLIVEPGFLAQLQKGIPPVKRMAEATDEMIEIYHEILRSKEIESTPELVH
jgi:glycosyltransferase involved in cell wall biosynthesis